MTEGIPPRSWSGSPRRNRSTSQRDKDRAAIRKTNAPCALCGQPIDYRLPYLDPGEYVVDHIVPVKRGGADTLSNKQPAHRSCNRAKGARTDGGPVVRRSGSLLRPQGEAPPTGAPPPFPA